MQSHTLLAALREVLAGLYPAEADARVVVADAGLDERQITFSSRAQTNWQNILAEAIRCNRLAALLAALPADYQNNPALQPVLANYHQLLAEGGSLTLDDTVSTLGPSPYQGMEYFDVADADRFFGREQLSAELVEHLRYRPLLAVVGASGSGKSSLVRAGLIPALQGTKPMIDGSQPPRGSSRWFYHIVTPTSHPLESLAASLTRSSESVTATSTLIDDLRRDARSLHLYARRLVRGDQRLLLVIDQLEELFTLCKDEAEQQALVENLLQAATPDGVVTLVLTLRADFYHHCARFPELRTALETQQKYIGAMRRDELRRAIEAPAKLGQWEFQAGLVDQLLADVGDEPGALPLLSHALLATWQRRSGRTLTLVGYRAAGGVQGAIAKTADDIYRAFSAQQQTIARTLFLRLTELGDGVQDTRRRVRPDELKLTYASADEVQQVLKTLADARLVTTATDEVQVAHEALIRAWATLRAWLDDDREGNRIQRRLTEAANQWVEFGRDANLLYRGVLLQQAQEWLQTTIDPPNQRESEFLDASVAEAEAEVKRAVDLAAEREATRQREAVAQFQRKWLWRLGFALILAILAILAAVWQYSIADNQKQQAQSAATSEAQAHATAVAAKRLVEADLWEKEALSLKAEKPLLALLLTLKAWPVQQSRGEPHVTNATRNMINLLLEVGGFPFIGHMARVHSLEFSPDSHWLVSASDDTTIRLWDISDSTGKSRVFAHPTKLQDVSFSPDNRWLATASDDQTIRLWTMDALDKPPRILRGLANTITQIAFSSDSQQLVAVDNDQTINLWNLRQVENEPTLSTEYTEFCHTIASVSSTSELGTFCEIRSLQNSLSSELGFLVIDAYY